MSKAITHILTKNNVRIHKKYLTDIVLPALQAITTSAIEKTYTIAGKAIKVLIYTPTLVEKTSLALQHLEAPIEKADLTIHVFDRPLQSPWSNQEYQQGFATNGQTEITDSFLGVYLGGEDTINLYDQKTQTGYIWIRDSLMLPDWVVSAPLRTLLHWFLAQHQIHLLHGAVIATNNKGILLTAKGGSGKSTTAITGLLSGMDYIGDDYVAIQNAQQPIAHSLYNSAKLTPESLSRFPELRKHIWKKPQPETEKSIIFISQVFPKQILKTVPLHAIMIPRIMHTATTRIVPATKMQALLAMIPTTIFQLPLASNTQVATLKMIINSTPCYFLELGEDRAEIPQAITSYFNEK